MVVLQNGNEPTTVEVGAVVLLNDGPPPTSVILAWLDRTLNLVERQRWSNKSPNSQQSGPLKPRSAEPAKLEHDTPLERALEKSVKKQSV